MRELKFRAWNPYKKVMLYWDSLFLLPACQILGANGYNPMQCTGFKDKNGTEIYEGDIIRDDIGCGEVEWVQEHCGFKVFTRNPSFYWNFESDGETKNTEVIGNIYENPELLEV